MSACTQSRSISDQLALQTESCGSLTLQAQGLAKMLLCLEQTKQTPSLLQQELVRNAPAALSAWPALTMLSCIPLSIRWYERPLPGCIMQICTCPHAASSSSNKSRQRLQPTSLV